MHRAETCNFIKKETLAQVISFKYLKFLRTTSLHNIPVGLLLSYGMFWIFTEKFFI